MEQLISIIVPIYNAERFLPETIASVMGQTYGHWELLLIDDASSDASARIAGDYALRDGRIKFFPSTENSGGPAGPRNRGLQYAKGDFIAFLDADDIWDERKLELQVIEMTTGTADIVGTNIIFFGESTRPWSTQLPGYPALKALLRRNRICTSSVLLRKKEGVCFDEDRRLVGVEDYHLWLTLVGRGYKVRIIYEPLVRYRVTPGSLIHKNEFFSILRAYYAVLKVAIDEGTIDRNMILVAHIAAAKELIKLGLKSLWKRR